MSFSALNATPNIGRLIEFSPPFKRADLIASNAKPRSMLGAGCEIISNGNELIEGQHHERFSSGCG